MLKEIMELTSLSDIYIGKFQLLTRSLTVLFAFLMFLRHSSMLNMEAEYLRNVFTAYQTTRRQIPEDSNLHSHRCKNSNLKLYQIDSKLLS
jgi:hypothetical protein